MVKMLLDNKNSPRFSKLGVKSEVGFAGTVLPSSQAWAAVDVIVCVVVDVAVVVVVAVDVVVCVVVDVAVVVVVVALAVASAFAVVA